MRPDTPKAEGWIAAAGPLTSLALAVGSIGAWLALGGSDADTVYVSVLAWLGVINVALALFNLLPGAPLDGGRILKAVRWQIHGNKYRAMREAAAPAPYLGWALAGLGLFLMLREQSGLWLMVTGVFIAINAKVEIAASYVGERLEGVKVRDLTWFGVAAGRHRHGRRHDALGAQPARSGGRRGRHGRRRASRRASCSRTRCGRCRPSSARG